MYHVWSNGNQNLLNLIGCSKKIAQLRLDQTNRSLFGNIGTKKEKVLLIIICLYRCTKNSKFPVWISDSFCKSKKLSPLVQNMGRSHALIGAY